MVSPARVAATAVASRPGTVEDLVRAWLGDVGEEAARLAGGESRLEFKRGHIAVIDVRNPDAVERIGIRFEAYKMRLTLHHQLGGDVADVDAMDFPTFMKMTPRQVAEWAVANTRGRAQVELFRRKQ